MTRTELLALAAALANDVPELLREGLPQHALRVDTAQALLRKLAALQPVAWRAMRFENSPVQATIERGVATGWAAAGGTVEPLYTLSEVLTDE